MVDPNAGKACSRSGCTGIIDAQISKEKAREHYFDFLPKEELAAITWRGKPIDKILNLNAFSDRKENISSKFEVATSVGVFKAWRQILQSGRSEFMRYYRREGRDNLRRLAKGLRTGSYECPRE